MRLSTVTHESAVRIIHGLLEDKHGEFFIQQAEPSTVQPSPDQSNGSASALDWHRSFEASPCPISEAIFRAPDPRSSMDQNCSYSKSKQVRMDLLPPGITDGTPLSILFIGKSVRALGGPGRSQQAVDLGAKAALDRLQAAEAFDPTTFELMIESIREKVGCIV